MGRSASSRSVSLQCINNMQDLHDCLKDIARKNQSARSHFKRASCDGFLIEDINIIVTVTRRKLRQVHEEGETVYERLLSCKSIRDETSQAFKVALLAHKWKSIQEYLKSPRCVHSPEA